MVAVALWWLGRQAKRDAPVSKGIAVVVTVAAVVVSLGAGLQIARIGHSGAESVWSDVGAEQEG